MVRWILRRIFYTLTEIVVKKNKVGILRVGNINYISLTELARYQNSSDPSFTIKNRLRRINTIDYIGLWKGTYGHPDIAFEFASWLSPEFKLYLITEFERLKANEAYQEKIDWQANRILAKLNYVVHTDAIKAYIVPTFTDAQKKFVYAEEADVLNVALFGMTAKEWKENNPEFAKNGNIRDYTDLLHLVILNNLEIQMRN